MLANSGSEAFEASGVTRRPGLLQRLRHDRSGNVSMLFGLVVIPLTAFIGLAVDFGRVYAVKSQTQSALDAAALAAGRVAQVDKVDTAQQGLGGGVGLFRQSQADRRGHQHAAVLPRRRAAPSSRSRPPRGSGRRSSA